MMSSDTIQNRNLLHYFVDNPEEAQMEWQNSCVGFENSMHQLSPYIGKLKSVIARYLILKYSKPGDLVVDPFSGAGTVPLEAALHGRNVFASDISPYARILTKGKLSVLKTEENSLSITNRLLNKSFKQPIPDLRKVPCWIRKFFHPETLKEAIRFSKVCRKEGYEFFLSCFLGILHHQRPGFLSYPSSHLVPYLKDRKFPKFQYPQMYEYRDVRSRLVAKIKRAYKRHIPLSNNLHWKFRQCDIQNLSFPEKFDCLITSPPYMNTLDYGRDNRLRLWFIDPSGKDTVDNPVTKGKEVFQLAMKSMAKKVNKHLKLKGYCILIVGERINLGSRYPLSESICKIFAQNTDSLTLQRIIRDEIPDIRRARRDCRGTKSEHILIFQKRK